MEFHCLECSSPKMGRGRCPIVDQHIFLRRVETMSRLPTNSNYCWWKKSCTSGFIVYPIIYRVLYIPRWFARFLPSKVVSLICHELRCFCSRHFVFVPWTSMWSWPCWDSLVFDSRRLMTSRSWLMAFRSWLMVIDDGGGNSHIFLEFSPTENWGEDEPSPILTCAYFFKWDGERPPSRFRSIPPKPKCFVWSIDPIETDLTKLGTLA